MRSTPGCTGEGMDSTTGRRPSSATSFQTPWTVHWLLSIVQSILTGSCAACAVTSIMESTAAGLPRHRRHTRRRSSE